MKYKTIGLNLDRDFRNDLNQNFGDIDTDIKDVNTKSKQRDDTLQTQLNTLVIEGDSSVEAAQARVEEDGTVNPTLKARLDKKEKEITSQLAQKALQSDLNTVNTNVSNLQTNKADKTEVNVLAMNKAEKTEVSDLSQRVTTTNDLVNSIIVTPAEGITEQEIIGSRKGLPSLVDKITSIDTETDRQRKAVFDALYRLGNEYLEKTGGWEQIFKKSNTTATITKNIDHISIFHTSDGALGDVNIVPVNVIDLTNVNTLYIDWEQTVNSTLSRSSFGVNKSRNTDRFTNEVVVHKSGLFKRTIDEIDVSALTGDYRIKIHSANASQSAGSADVKVYGVYSDEKLLRMTDIQRYISYVAPSTSAKPDYNTTTKVFDFKSDGSARILYSNTFYDIPANTTVTNGLSTSGVVLVFNVDTKAFSFIASNTTRKSNQLIILTIRQLGTNIPVITSIFDVTVDGANVGGSTEMLPVYAINDLADVQSKVMEIQDFDTLSFAFITDTHGDGTGSGSQYEQIKNHLRAVVEMSDYGSLDFICLGGDVTSGKETKAKTEAKLSELTKILNKNKRPVFTLFGNHDDNSYLTTTPNINDVITKLEWFKRVIKPYRNGEIHDSQLPHSAYFYQDFEDKKVRVVCLDATDYPVIDTGDGFLKHHGRNFWGFGARQVEWLATEALDNIPDGYKLVILSHTVTRGEFSNYPSYIFKNGDLVEGILKACHDGNSFTDATSDIDWGTSVSVDYTSQEARRILAYVHGHNHTDTIYNTDLGFPVIGVINSVASGTSRKLNTDTEAAWDVITVNTQTNKVDCIRYGFGADRSVTAQ